MKRVLEENLIYEILSVVDEILEGSVATYGQIAKLIGRDKNASLPYPLHMVFINICIYFLPKKH